MERRGVIWLVLIVAIMLLSYVVPYTLLSKVDAWYGSALLWVLGAIVVIGINAVASSGWRD